MKEIKFTATQDAIINAKTGNILVNAGAGAGKTMVLTERIIHLLRDEHYSLSEMIVLTFTELAAKEMKDRIIKKLSAENDPVLQEELAHIDEADIETFDSFCHKIVVKYSLYSNISSSFNIGDAALFTMKKTEYIKEALAPYFLNPSQDFISIMTIFSKSKDASSFTKYLSDVYDKVQNVLDPESYLVNYQTNYYNETAYNKIKDTLFNLLKIHSSILQNVIINPPSSKFENFASDVNGMIEDVLNSKDLDSMLKAAKSVLEYNHNSPSATKNDKIDYTDFSNNYNTYKAYRQSLKELFGSYSFDDDLMKEYIDSKGKTKIISDILLEVDKKMREFKKYHNIYSFLDVEKEAIQILENHENIRSYYKNHIKEILIDEYQDTNDLNSYLISLISNNNEMVVGDVKQSIYRFRNANPNIFENRLKEYKDGKGQVFELKENFRSRGEIISQVNDLFSHIADYPYINVDYFHETLCPGLMLYDEHKSSMKNVRIIEYDKDVSSSYDLIASDIIKRIQDKEEIYDHKTKSYRPIKFSDIFVLSRVKNNMDEIQSSFEKHGIPMRVFKEDSFTSLEEVIFVKNALKIVNYLDKKDTENPGFNLALTSILRSFVLTINDDMIQKYFMRENQETNLSSLKKNFPSLYLSFVDLLEALHKDGLDALLQKLYSSFNIYQKLITLNNTMEREVKLNILKDSLSSFCKSKMTLSDIIGYFDYLSKNELDLSEKINTLDDINSVSLMTIHKSKGLEKPVVYLVDLDRKIKNIPPNFTLELGFNLKSDNSLISSIIKNYDKVERNKEFLRILYVGMTRARESLNLVFDESGREYTGNFLKASFLENFLVLNYSFDPELFIHLNDDQKLIKSPLNELINPPLHEYPEVSFDEPTLITSKKASHEISEMDDETQELLRRGNEIHQAFERTSFLQGFSESIKEEGFSVEVASYLEAFKNQPIFKGKTLREFHELPFFNGDTRGIIDYLLLKEDCFIVVDFKTSDISNPLYVDQLHSYLDYCKTITSKPIELYLYSIMHNILKKID